MRKRTAALLVLGALAARRRRRGAGDAAQPASRSELLARGAAGEFRIHDESMGLKLEARRDTDVAVVQGDARPRRLDRLARPPGPVDRDRQDRHAHHARAGGHGHHHGHHSRRMRGGARSRTSRPERRSCTPSTSTSSSTTRASRPSSGWSISSPPARRRCSTTSRRRRGSAHEPARPAPADRRAVERPGGLRRQRGPSRAAARKAPAPSATAVAAEGELGRPTAVPAQANLFGAGLDQPPAPGSGGPGVLPPCWRLPDGARRVVTFPSATGRVTPIEATLPRTAPKGTTRSAEPTSSRSAGSRASSHQPQRDVPRRRVPDRRSAVRAGAADAWTSRSASASTRSRPASPRRS